MLTPAEKLEKIIEQIEAGKTIIFANYLTHTEVSPKTYRSFIKDGLPMFRATEDHLLVNMGKRGFQSVNGCKVMVR